MTSLIEIYRRSPDRGAAVAVEKQRALKLIRSGEITVAEAAGLIGTTRQRIAYWCRQAGLSPVIARESRLTRLWKTTKP